MPRAQRHARRRCGRIAGGWGRREAFRMQSRRGAVSSSGLRSLCRCSPDPERRGSPTPRRAIPSFTDGNDYSGAVRRCLSADQPARGMNRASPEWRTVIYWASHAWSPDWSAAAADNANTLRLLTQTSIGFSWVQGEQLACWAEGCWDTRACNGGCAGKPRSSVFVRHSARARRSTQELEQSCTERGR